jgi:cytochrome c-type biogenesis protein
VIDNVSPLVALAGGMLSLLSPCVLPMIPVYLASLAGPEILREGSDLPRWTIFWHSVLFVTGFSLVFISLGTLAGLTGSVINAHSPTIRWISGGMMVIFGLFMLAAPRISWLNYEKRLTASSSTASGYLRSILLGSIFALAWTPCVGPVLGGILSLALNSQTVWQGTWLLTLYSLGAAVPFIIIGLTFQKLKPVINWLKRFSGYIYILSGFLLIGAGILILLNKLNWLRW